MKNLKITNVPIYDSDVLRTACFLPRTDNELGTVNVAFKRYRKSKF